MVTLFSKSKQVFIWTALDQVFCKYFLHLCEISIEPFPHGVVKTWQTAAVTGQTQQKATYNVHTNRHLVVVIAMLNKTFCTVYIDTPRVVVCSPCKSLVEI